MHLSPARILNFIRREAVLCCAALAALASTLFVPPSAAYISYFDFRVLCLLFCLMAVVAGLRGCGLFEALALRLLRGKKTLRFLALMLVLLPFFSSMLVTNDVALLTFVPFAILILNMADASAYAPYIIVLQTVAANLGSMATPVGNPQNLFLNLCNSTGNTDTDPGLAESSSSYCSGYKVFQHLLCNCIINDHALSDGTDDLHI